MNKKKTKKQKAKHISVYYRYTQLEIERTWGDEDGGDEWSATYSYTLDSLQRSPPAGVYWDKVNFYGKMDAEDQQCYAVVVRYSSGDTFGSSSGNGTVFAVFEKEADAQKLKSEISAGHNIDYIPGNKEWLGYFERLETCSVQPMKLGK